MPLKNLDCFKTNLDNLIKNYHYQYKKNIFLISFLFIFFCNKNLKYNNLKKIA